ncbi:MAG: COX15/CtaA family protein [Bacteroidia bacterium]|nr:COX15/CtaA family protein [Bacteroidia bacterium]
MLTPEWKHILRFRRLALGVFLLFFLVILAGVTVRVLGAGMGCPDWPTCYGQLIPPTHESQLPADYRERYAVAGRLAEPFDPFKTWVEYLNRLVSVLAGISVIFWVGYAWFYLRAYPVLLRYVTAVPILLVIQALLGWRVVATYLAEYMISIHMFFSLLLTMSVLLAWAWTFRLSERAQAGDWRFYEALGWVSWGALLVQVFLGTLVRSAIARYGVEEGLDRWIFYLHRTFSWFVLAGWSYFHWRVYREPVRLPLARRWASWTTIALLIQAITGAVMVYIRFAAPLQVMHLVLSLFAVNSGFISMYFLRYSGYGSTYKSIPRLFT